MPDPAGESPVVGYLFAMVDRFPFAAAGGSAGAGADLGGKVGLPALDVALAFPQATPASLFPPAGEISLSRSLALAASALAVSVVAVVLLHGFELQRPELLDRINYGCVSGTFFFFF